MKSQPVHSRTMSSPGRRFTLNTREVAAKVTDGEAVLINLATGVYYGLSGSGGAVWELLVAGADVETIVREVVERYGAEPVTVRADVEGLVETLVDERLLLEDADRPAPTELPAVSSNGAYEAPVLEKYTDLGDLLALDPPMPGLTDIPWTRSKA